MTKLEPVVNVPVSEAVYRRLRDAILSGQFHPGQRLVERDLSQQLGVSHIPVREALKMLARDGLVQFTPFKGAHVIRLTPEELRDFYEVRAVLEGFAARLAAERITSAEIERLRELVSQARQATQNGNLSELALINVQFHNTIAEAARNHVLSSFLERIRNQVQFFMLQSLSVPGRPPKTLSEHEAILVALEGRDPSRAEQAAITHVLAAASMAQEASRDTGRATQ